MSGPFADVRMPIGVLAFPTLHHKGPSGTHATRSRYPGGFVDIGIRGGGALAAEIRSLDIPAGSGHGIVLSGIIAPGDETAFHTLAETFDNAVVLTTGPGGAVATAVSIGSEIRARGWLTLVPAGAQCARSCRRKLTGWRRRLSPMLR